MPDNETRKRRRRVARDNWYRDVWLLIITGIVLFAIVVGRNQNIDRVNDVQNSRREAIVIQCNEVNSRHLDTIATLDRVLLQRLTHRVVASSTPRDVVARRLREELAKIPASQRARLTQSRTFTVLLIDALTPLQNCEQRADRLVP